MDNIYWIKGPWSGRLAIMARPRGDGWLEDEVKQWRRAGIEVVVSLLMSGESAELGLTAEAALSRRHGLQFLAFPIVDRSIPSSVQEMQLLVEKLIALLTQGKTVGIHCRHGIGRSALVAATLLVHAGVDSSTAFRQIERARGVPVPDTLEQKQWVDKFAIFSVAPVFP